MADRGSGKGSFPWVKVRKSLQWISFWAFVVLMAVVQKGIASGQADRVGFTAYPFQLDPLVVLSQLLANKAFWAGSALALITLVLTLGLGRVWCGWICPLGTLLEWIPIRKWKKRDTRVPDGWRRVKYVLLLTIMISAVFSSLTLLVFDPLTIVYRAFISGVWPAADRVITAGETWLYPVSFLQPVINRFDLWARRFFLPTMPVEYRFAWLQVTLLAGVIGLNTLAPRFWCRYLCPLGALLGLVSKGAVVSCQIKQQECTNCQLCETVCPTGAIEGSGPAPTCAPSECTMCLSCWETCSRGAVDFSPQVGFSGWQEYDPGRRQVLLSLGVSLAGLGLAQTGLGDKNDHPHLIRPPGTAGTEFLSSCVRCGACLAACPTGAIQPSLGEAGWEGLWSPILIPRLGYCDYSCRACGQSCPVEAIPLLSLQEKREQVLGNAVIDRQRCLAWAEETDCIVCEEMCPVPEKAITLQEAVVLDEAGNRVIVQQPYVHHDQCIGCGICEYQCPVDGQAAIRVFAPDQVPRGQKRRMRQKEHGKER